MMARKQSVAFCDCRACGGVVCAGRHALNPLRFGLYGIAASGVVALYGDMTVAHGNSVRRAIGAMGRGVVKGAALLLGAFIIMGVTGIPRVARDWLTTASEPLGEAPRVIVVLGGEGIPSESGLMRTYCAAQLGLRYPAARLICCLPADGDPDASSVGRMRDELVLRGVARERVSLETHALNTHAQAVAVRAQLGEAALAEPLLVVTSPSHARRSLLCFRKAGFRKVGCEAAIATDAEADMGSHVFLRYGFWNMLEAQVRYGRELTAMLVYKLRGWI